MQVFTRDGVEKTSARSNRRDAAEAGEKKDLTEELQILGEPACLRAIHAVLVPVASETDKLSKLPRDRWLEL